MQGSQGLWYLMAAFGNQQPYTSKRRLREQSGPLQFPLQRLTVFVPSEGGWQSNGTQ